MSPVRALNLMHLVSAVGIATMSIGAVTRLVTPVPAVVTGVVRIANAARNDAERAGRNRPRVAVPIDVERPAPAPDSR